jgi:hypothetical protein
MPFKQNGSVDNVEAGWKINNLYRTYLILSPIPKKNVRKVLGSASIRNEGYNNTKLVLNTTKRIEL